MTDRLLGIVMAMRDLELRSILLVSVCDLFREFVCRAEGAFK